MGLFGGGADYSVFGKRDPLGVDGSQPIGNWGATPLQVPIPQPAPQRGGMFANGGLSKKQILLGGLMDAIGSFAGRQPSFIPQVMQQQQQDRLDEREDSRWERRQTAEMDQKRRTPQAVNLGNGGFGVWSPEDGLRIEREPTQQPGEQERLLERYLDPATPDNIKTLIRPMLRGANLDASVMAPIIQLKTDAAQEVKQTVPGKAAGSGGGGGASSTRVVNGRAYYKINGAWYDNPEGR